jgi:hypothetical protein
LGGLDGAAWDELKVNVKEAMVPPPWSGGKPEAAAPGARVPKEAEGEVMVTPGVVDDSVPETPVAVPAKLLRAVTVMVTISPGSSTPSPLPAPPPEQTSASERDWM